MDDKPVMPAARVDADGSHRDMDSPFEQGVYYAVIGLRLSDNPFPRNQKFMRRRFEQGFKHGASRPRIQEQH